MQLKIEQATATQAKADALLLGMFQDTGLAGDAAEVDALLGGAIAKAKERKQFNGEMKELLSISSLGKLGYDRILLVGLGPKDKYTAEILRRACAAGAKAARGLGAKTLASRLHMMDGMDAFAAAKASAEGFVMGLYQFIHHKTVEVDKIKVLDSVSLLVSQGEQAEQAKAGLQEGEILGSVANYVRNLVNEPANIITPTQMAQEAHQIAKEHKLKLTILDAKDMEKLGMHALLAVTKGSTEPPKFIILEYGKGEKSIAFLGKGITFDSGGLSLKPPKYMEDMKTDMGGAAAVLGTMKALALLKVPIKAFGVIPTCENMPGGHATRPGDVVKAMNGKSIEILNTDAEGRLILADALSYTEAKLKPDYMVDLATLTGACVVALGHEATAVLGTDDALISGLDAAGKATYERVWPLPLWDEYKDRMKSDIADVRNINVVPGGEAGTITAAVFLGNFVDKTPWAHLDIAGTAYISEEKDYLLKGATGVGPRLLVELSRHIGGKS